MSKRDEFVRKIEAALEELQVKRSLARLEARELRGELLEKYDRVQDRLRALKEASGERWDGLREGTEAAWKAFRTAWDAATHEQPR